ncbi:unnamed protein product [Ostreobium quekettii]|uniref:J domain-containing protein n=1 Tax=Ostreobium quekettii TaxID=121088 RepID=A0A8S1IMR1_9CHLO|nr:unnamed protein product [Ostreobium quekettii]
MSRCVPRARIVQPASLCKWRALDPKLLRHSGHAEGAARGRPNVVLCSAAKNLYDVLGVQQSASTKELKAAYRKKALKLHPDVNKSPNAKDDFIDVMHAYQTLSDPAARAKYDTKLRLGFDERSSGKDGFRPGYDWSYETGRKREEEIAFSLEDLLRELEKELNIWTSKRSKEAPPKGFWAALGEEFVEFLEEGIGIKNEGDASQTTQRRSSSGKSRPSSRTSQPYSNSERPRAPTTETPPPATRDENEEVEEMLRALKKKKGL